MTYPTDYPTVTVAVSDLRSGTGPLTWGQHAIMSLLDLLGEDAHTSNVSAWEPCEPGTGTAAALAVIKGLLTRYETLRTRFPQLGEERVQLLDGDGSVEVEIVPAEGEEAAVIARRERSRLRETRFDLVEGWPVRFAVVTEGDTALAVVFACSHAVADLWGARALRPVLARPDAGAESTQQPLDRAAFENSPAGDLVNQRSLAHWRQQLTRMPRTLFPNAPLPPHEGKRFWYGSFESPAMDAALSALAARYRVSSSTVLFAATSAVLARNAGVESCPLGVVSANRAGARNSVSTLSQLSLITLPVGERPLPDLVRAAMAANLEAYRHGAYDPRSRDALLAEVSHTRGLPIDMALWLNDLRTPGPGQAGNGPGQLELGSMRWKDANDEGDSTFYVFVEDWSGCLSLYVMHDTFYLPPRTGELLLGDLERLLVDEAGNELPSGRPVQVPTTASWRPRGTDWQLVDSSWIRLRDVRALLQGIGDWSAVGVFLETSQDGTDSLVARLTPKTEAVSPADLHTACMAALPEYRSAIAPHRYVVHATAPADEADEADWQRQPVLHEGDGR
ncbi:condensation domain-containing protein [Streptomyces sp. NBRC 109706]|uniref:condensation domain-containing protein n=1 Tax=Streptomyces sp. NBRC 109706 TaxID=1550035 RepID=UPI000783D640|nr:condensation domain-containing protein [Streptomyces sp. NBRC 109706]